MEPNCHRQGGGIKFSLLFFLSLCLAGCSSNWILYENSRSFLVVNERTNEYLIRCDSLKPLDMPTIGWHEGFFRHEENGQCYNFASEPVSVLDVIHSEKVYSPEILIELDTKVGFVLLGCDTMPLENSTWIVSASNDSITLSYDWNFSWRTPFPLDFLDSLTQISNSLQLTWVCGGEVLEFQLPTDDVAPAVMLDYKGNFFSDSGTWFRGLISIQAISKDSLIVLHQNFNGIDTIQMVRAIERPAKWMKSQQKFWSNYWNNNENFCTSSLR